MSSACDGIFRQVFAALPCPSVILDASLNVIDVSETYLAVADCTRSAIVGHPFRDALSRGNLQSVANDIFASVQSATSTRQSSTLDPIKAEPSGRWWKVKNKPIEADHLLHQLEDVTVSVKRVAELELGVRENQLFKLMVSSVKDYAIFLLDPNGRILTWNDGAKRLKYYDEKEIVGQHFSVFYQENDIKARKPEIEIQAATAQGRVEDEGWRKRKDGTLFWARVVLTAIYNADKVLIGFAKITQDLTEKRQTEHKIMEAYKESSRLKSEFLANMSHEIRTPMNCVIGMTELLSLSDLKAEQREQVDWIRKSGDALISIINDILDLSKIEAGKLTIINESFALHELLQDMEKYAEVMLVSKADVGFVFQVENIPADVTVEGDAGRLRQVLNNLLSNAIKFTPQGTVTLRVSGKHIDSKSIRLLFAVADTGIGIAEDDQKRLFTTFTQVDSSETRRYKGSGLGLSISKRLVELMHGELHLTSALKSGSIFSFELELKRTESAKEMGPRKPSKGMGAFKGHLLIVDDNPMNVLVSRRMVEKLGCQTDDAADGVEAVERVSQKNYDLVFMDIQMPRKSGYEAAKEIRAMGKTVPIVALTANAMQGDMEKCRNAGMDDYLSKPIKIEHIAAILEKYLLPGRSSEDTTRIICSSASIAQNDA